MNAPALFASPAPDSSDRFKTLKTDSILPCIWPSLNPLTNYWLAEQVSAHRGAIPIQILPSSLVLSHISLSSAFFSGLHRITILSRMCFFSLSFCHVRILFFYFLLSANTLVSPPPHPCLLCSLCPSITIPISSLPLLLLFSTFIFPFLHPFL